VKDLVKSFHITIAPDFPGESVTVGAGVGFSTYGGQVRTKEPLDPILFLGTNTKLYLALIP
jgi:hypothetical protein